MSFNKNIKGVTKDHTYSRPTDPFTENFWYWEKKKKKQSFIILPGVILST